MADVRFRRDQPAELRVGCGGAERLGEGRDLDGVADGGAGAVRLDELDVTRREVGDGECLLDDVGVTVDARGQVADLARAVVVDRRRLDHGEDRIAVLDGVGHAAQRHDTGTTREHGPGRPRVEGPAPPVRGEDLALVVDVSLRGGEPRW